MKVTITITDTEDRKSATIEVRYYPPLTEESAKGSAATVWAAVVLDALGDVIEKENASVTGVNVEGE